MCPKQPTTVLGLLFDVKSVDIETVRINMAMANENNFKKHYRNSNDNEMKAQTNKFSVFL